MGTEVQFNMYFSRYHAIDDPKDKASNKNSSLSYENCILRNTQQDWNGLPRRNLPFGSEIDKASNKNTTLSYENCILMNTQNWNGLPRRDLSFRSEKEQMRQTMLKQETIFRNQLHELHRLYRIQRNLMSEAKSKPQLSFLSSSCIESQQDTNRWPNYKPCSNHGIVDVSEKNVPESSSGILKQKNWYLPEPKIQRQLFDLERPADEYINGEEDLSSSCLKEFFLMGEFQKPDLFAKLYDSQLYQVDNVCLSGKAAASSSSCNNFFSQSSSFQIRSSSSQVTFNKLLESTASVQPWTDRRIFGVEIPDRNNDASSTITNWNNGSSGSKNEESMRWQSGNLMPLGPTKQESSYQMSTDSLQKKFPQFVQDSSSSTRDSKRIKSDDRNHSGLGDIGGYDRNLTVTSPKSREVKAEEEVALGSRNLFDLNVCLTEEEEDDQQVDASLIQCHEKSTEIDLEVSITKTEESESDKSAAETLIVLSTLKTDQQSSPNGSLDWFADIISSLNIEINSVDIENESFIPEGMDYFEFVTLNLTESTENQPEEHNYENVSSLPRKGPTRRGRPRKDFQRDVLPGLTSLSRNEVTEDLHAIEGLIKAAKCRSKGPKSRNKRQCTSKCGDEGTLTLMQWGKKGRRPKRRRCSSTFQPVALKEVF